MKLQSIQEITKVQLHDAFRKYCSKLKAQYEFIHVEISTKVPSMAKYKLAKYKLYNILYNVLSS